MNTGKKIKEYRKKCNLSQPALAEKTGISYSQIQKVELGLRVPSENQLSLIADALNTNVINLTGAKEGSFESKIETFLEFINAMDVSFEGEKDDTGKFLSETLLLKINGPEYMKKIISDYADAQETVKFLRQQAALMPDKEAMDLLEHRAEEIHLNYSESIYDKISKYVSEDMPGRMNKYLKNRKSASENTTILDLLKQGYSFSIENFDDHLDPETIRFDIRQLCALTDMELAPFLKLAYASGIDSEEKSYNFFLYNEDKYPYICLHVNHTISSNLTGEEYKMLNNAYDTSVFYKTGTFGPQNGYTYLTRGKTIASCFDSLNEKIVALLIDANPSADNYDAFLADVENKFGKDIFDCVELLTSEDYINVTEHIKKITDSGNIMAVNIELVELMYANMVLDYSPSLPIQKLQKTQPAYYNRKQAINVMMSALLEYKEKPRLNK